MVDPPSPTYETIWLEVLHEDLLEIQRLLNELILLEGGE